jgi:hypothetical protein
MRSGIGRTGRRLGLIVALSAIPASMVITGLLIWHASYAAFTASSSTGTNSWTSGTVAITNDQSGVVVWNLTGAKPDTATSTLSPPASGTYTPAAGSSAGGAACFKVTYSGNLAADVRVYASTLTETGGNGGLGPFMLFSLDTGTDAAGGSDLTCAQYTTSGTYNFGSSSNSTIFLSTFPTTYLGAASSWTPSSTTTKWYRLSWLLPQNTNGTTAQGQQVQVVFKWEADNT